jgi:DNA-binding response OmpR family regulator
MDASDLNAIKITARVLLVEDHERLAVLIAEYLGRNGMEMHSVRRGGVAIEKTHELEPDLLLLDVMLPGLDGFEICRELGADEFIPKPVQPRVLLAHVRAILRRAGMRERLASSGDTIVFGTLDIDTSSREVRLGARPVDLTTPARW